MLNRQGLTTMRHRRRLSQERLGQCLGQDQQYVSKLERGAIREITATTLARLCQALDVSADYLLGLTEDHRPPHHTRRLRMAPEGHDG